MSIFDRNPNGQLASPLSPGGSGGGGGGGTGDVVGPAAATDNAVARYDTATGKLLQNSLFIITDAGAATTAAGTAALPAYSFSADPDTGAYNSGADQFDIATAGASRFSVRTDHLLSTVRQRGPNGSLALPTYSFSGDTNTGYTWVGADESAIIGGGAEQFRFSALQHTSFKDIIPSDDVALNLGSSSNRWQTIVTAGLAANVVNGNDAFVVFQHNGTDRAFIRQGNTTPSGVTGTIAFKAADAGIIPMSWYTGNNTANNSVATAAMYRETGNKTAGAGNSGGLFDTTGSVVDGDSGNHTRVSGPASGAGNSGNFSDATGAVVNGTSGSHERRTGASSTVGTSGDIIDQTGVTNVGNSGNWLAATGDSTDGISGAATRTTGVSTNNNTGSIFDVTGDAALVSGSIHQVTGSGATRGDIIQDARLIDQSAAVLGTRFSNLAAAPTAVGDGQVYYDTTLNKLRVRAGGAWQTITSV